MLELMTDQLHRCTDVRSVLDCLLDRALELSGTSFGNIQLMDWKAGHLEIRVQRGFREEFMNFFERVRLDDSSACARVLRTRAAVVIEDVVVDRQFSPCLEIVRGAGIRAVQSTPLVSSSGALLGVLSTHFPAEHRPTDIQMCAMKDAAQLAANAIIRFRAGAIDHGEGALDGAADLSNQPDRPYLDTRRRLLTSQKLLLESRETIVVVEKLLARDPWRTGEMAMSGLGDVGF